MLMRFLQDESLPMSVTQKLATTPASSQLQRLLLDIKFELQNSNQIATPDL
jgi:hypothetical protein